MAQRRVAAASSSTTPFLTLCSQPQMPVAEKVDVDHLDVRPVRADVVAAASSARIFS